MLLECNQTPDNVFVAEGPEEREFSSYLEYTTNRKARAKARDSVECLQPNSAAGTFTRSFWDSCAFKYALTATVSLLGR